MPASSGLTRTGTLQLFAGLKADAGQSLKAPPPPQLRGQTDVGNRVDGNLWLSLSHKQIQGTRQNSAPAGRGN